MDISTEMYYFLCCLDDPYKYKGPSMKEKDHLLKVGKKCADAEDTTPYFLDIRSHFSMKRFTSTRDEEQGQGLINGDI